MTGPNQEGPVVSLKGSRVAMARPVDWHGGILSVPLVGSRDSLTHLLATFLEGDTFAALVRDKEGENVGWITMDDVTRVLMGEG